MGQFWCWAATAFFGSLIGWWWRARGADAYLERAQNLWTRRQEELGRAARDGHASLLTAQEECDALRVRLQELERELAGVREQLAQRASVTELAQHGAQTELERARSHTQQLLAQLDERTKEVGLRATELAEQANERAGAQRAAAEANAARTALESELAAERSAKASAVQALEHALAQARGAIESRAQEYAGLLERFREVEPLPALLRRKDEELAALQRRLAEIEKELGAALRSLDEATKRAGSLEGVQVELRAREAELAAARQRAATEEQRADAAQRNVAQARQRIGELEPLQTRLQQRDQEMGQLHARIGQLDGVAHQLAQREQALAQARTTLQSRDAELTALHGRLEQVETAARRERTELEMMRAHAGDIESLRSELEERQHALQQLTTRMAELQIDKDRSAANVTLLQSRLDALTPLPEQLAQREAELAALRTRAQELEKLPAQLDERDQVILQLRAEIEALRRQPLSEVLVVETGVDTSKEAPLAHPIGEIEQTRKTRSRARVPAVPRQTKSSNAAAKAGSQGNNRARAERDDLKLIHGVGPVMEKLLNDNGVLWFRQVAKWKKKDIAKFEALLPNFNGRIERENWVRSAIEQHYKSYGTWLGEGEPGIAIRQAKS